MRTRRTSAIAAALSATILIAACSGTPAKRVATLNGGSGSSSSSPNAKSFQDAMLEFARCMRDHGIDMPDPTFDGQGHVQMTLNGGPKDESKMKAAQTACQPIMDRAQQDAPRPSPEEQAAMRDKLLGFAKCMREHGVNIPDPNFDANGGVGIKATAHGGQSPDSPSSASVAPTQQLNIGGVDINLSDPNVKAAMDACDAAGKGLPKGPGPDAQPAGGSGVSTGRAG